MDILAAVGYEQESLKEEASLLARQLNFKLEKDSSHCVFVTEAGYALKIPGFSPLFADFTASNWIKKVSTGKKLGIVRACKPAKGLKIVDATAGWGRDAAILASLGAQVLMLERNPVMAVLLDSALSRRSDEDKKQLSLSLQAIDARTYLSNLAKESYPDIVYIDPMHPERTKAALVKKDLQALQQMIGEDRDALDLLTLARSRVKQKVVVKWPQKKPPLLPTPSFIAGKTVRFDIYWPDHNLKMTTVENNTSEF